MQKAHCTMTAVDAAKAHWHPTMAILLVLGLCGLGSFLLLSVGSVLKENALFWRNAGGYPLELRTVVLYGYYPLLLINAVLCCGATAVGVHEYRTTGCLCGWSLTLVAILWSLLFLNVGFILANNIENVLSGRPIHYHSIP
jgi:hypothetical protein